MDLKTYLAAKRGRATWLAAQLDGVSPSYLSQMASGDAPISPKRGVEIETVTGGEVTRQEMFRNDWQAIWPELATSDCCRAVAPNVPEDHPARNLPSAKGIMSFADQSPLTSRKKLAGPP